MSCLDCSCILRTPVESIRPEELSQSSIHECLVRIETLTPKNEVVLSHFFQHPNIMTFWTVFTAGSWLWVISPFMAYGKNC
ncbi:hypothetical protein EK904_002475 [Melospiza melodia maxima]|nr:hypothetical protein EK904_002475 [Melospiza melodia maxima]